MNKSEKIRFYYGIFLSVLTVAVGIVFIIQVTMLYYSGLDEKLHVIYTVERISERLTLPLVFLFLWIAAIIAGYVLSVIFPLNKKRLAVSDNGKTLRMLLPRVPQNGAKEGFDAAKKAIKREELIRMTVWCVACAVLLAGAIVIMIYVYDPSHYHGASTWKSDIFELVKHIIWWVLAGLIVTIGAVVYEGFSMKKEVSFVKTAIATGDRKTVPPAKVLKKKVTIFITVAVALLSLGALILYIIAPMVLNSLISPIVEGTSNKIPTASLILIAFLFLILVVAGLIMFEVIKKYVPEKADKLIVLCTQIAVGSVSIAFIIAGALNGGAQDVLIKAINICTECIGLG